MLTAEDVRRIAAAGESLTVELKGEIRAPLADTDLYEAVVCLANAEGGVILVGVEDDGTVTGLSPQRGKAPEASRLQSAVFNNTSPPINTRVSIVDVDGRLVAGVEVDPYPEVCATRSGRCVRRVVQPDGPQCVPFYPYEHVQRRSALGLADLSSMPLPELEADRLDPLQVERARKATRCRSWSGWPSALR